MTFAVRAVKANCLSDILQVISREDYVLGKMSKQTYGLFSEYYAWPGVSARGLLSYINSLPKEERAYHTICGRTNVPLDFFADLDLKMNPASQADKKKAAAILQSVVDEASKVMVKCFGCDFTKVIALQSFSPHKFSFHVHARVAADVAFRDMTELKKFAVVVEKYLRLRHHTDVMDMAVYRSGGQLRLFKCVKTVGDTISLDSSALTRPYGWTPTDEEMFEMSLITRRHSDITRFLDIDGGTKSDSGNKVGVWKQSSPPLGEVGGGGYNQQQSFPSGARYVVDTVQKLPANLADDYKSWIGVGLALRALDHHAQQSVDVDMQNNDFQEIFHSFSAQSPKYERDEISRMWSKMRSVGDWKKSVNYIRKVARESGGPSQFHSLDRSLGLLK